MTIKNKVILCLVLSISTIVTLLVTISYIDFRESSVSHTTTQLRRETEAGVTAIEQKMEVYFRGLELAASVYNPDRIAGATTPEAMAEDLNVLKSLQTQFNALESYSGHADGITYSGSRNGAIPGFNAKELKREWFLRIFGGEKRLITKPYVSSKGDLVMALAVPVVRDGQVVATMNVNLRLDDIKSFTDTLYATDNFDLTRPDGYVIASIPEWIGKNQYERYPDTAQYQNSESGFDTVRLNGEEYQVVFDTVPNLGWKVWRYEKSSDIYADSNKNLQKAIFLGLVCFIVAVGIIVLLIVRSFKPLERLKYTIKNLASGDGDLTQRLPVKGNNEISEISREFNDFISNVHGMIVEISDSSQTISRSVNELGESNNRNDGMLCKHGNETDDVVTAIKEMRVNATNVADNAVNAAKLTEQTNSNVHESKRAIEKSNSTIGQLVTEVQNVSSQITNINSEITNVTEVLTVIGSIAEQTNLLALNAAIEAARAGDQGRGFAVVADEVRALAARTQSCTSEIEETLTRLQSSSGEAINAAEASEITCKKTSESVVVINEELDTIIHSVEEMDELNKLIATSVEDQSTFTNDIADNINHIHEIVTELMNSSKSTIEETEKLTNSNHRLVKIVDKFVL